MNRAIQTVIILATGACVGMVSNGFAEQPSMEWREVLSEGFAGGMENWRITGGEWRVEAGRLICFGPAADDNFIANPIMAPFRRNQIVEGTVVVQKRLVESGWSFAGIAIVQDAGNLWLLALTEGPDGRRYVDFLESCEGKWQAQNEPGFKLKPLGEQSTRVPWTPGSGYRLRLEMTEHAITGTVSDAPTRLVLAHGSYSLKVGNAVRAGFAGFIVRGSKAAFDSFTVCTSQKAESAPASLDVEHGKRGNIAVLADDLAGYDQNSIGTLASTLRKEDYGVTALSADQVCDEQLLSPELFFMYIVPNARVYPANGVTALTAFAQGGGHIFFLGGPAFESMAWRYENRWLTWQEIDDLKRKVKPERFVFKRPSDVDLSKWRRATNDSTSPGGWTLDSSGRASERPCFRFWSSKYSGWDGHLSPSMEGIFASDHGLLCFQAKGDGKTPQISVELQEDDGSRWIATVNISAEWESYVLAPEDFPYWQDSPTKNSRGGSGDRLNPARARRINFGLSRTHTNAVPGGEHTFWVREIGAAPNPFANLQTPDTTAPSLESVSPSYKTYPLRNIASVRPAPECGIAPAGNYPTPKDGISCVPRMMGRGFGRGQKWRWIPLLEALDAEGTRRGTPLWLLVNRTLPYVGSVFAALGYNEPAEWTQPVLESAIVAAINHIQRGLFLVEAGSEHFAHWPGETIRLGARVMNVGARPQNFTLRLRVEDRNSKVIFEKANTLDVGRRNIGTMRAEWKPTSKEPAVYHVGAELLLNGKVIDSIQHELAVLDPGTFPREEFVTVKGSDFYLKGKKWYPVGVNFWPLYVSGMDHPDFWSGWIDRRFYEPEEVERDLKRMADLGINMVSIQTVAPRFYRNLLDFLRRCRNHGIKANLFVGQASPLAFRAKQLRAFIRTARLADNPTVFAYDTIWEPGNYVFRGDRRSQWDGEWREWLVERYGGIENAEKDWNFRAPRDADGRVRSPLDRHFRADGHWKIMMAAYRRFMDDLMSSKWNAANRKLRRMDPNHLVSFRQGNTLPHDFAFTATPKHIDFICPEGYSISGDENSHNAAGFITRYVHFTTGGKPIIWSEFGRSVWDRNSMRPSEHAIEHQAEYHRLFYRMVIESGANGTAPWWWPGGYRVGERSDYGIVNPDGTPRPSAQLIALYAPQIKADRAWPAPTAWYEMDRDTHAGGYWRVVFNEGRDAYRSAIAGGGQLGIRTKGTGTTSLDTPLIAVGNVPYNGGNPPKYLNAEFNWLKILDAQGDWVEATDGVKISVKSGAPVLARACVGNTQEAAWITPKKADGKPGGVWLSTTPSSLLNARIALPRETPYLDDADFGELTLCEGIRARTEVEVQMTAEGRAWFGEKRTFVLVPRK